MNLTPEIHEYKEKVIEKKAKMRNQQDMAVKRQLVIENDSSDEYESALEELKKKDNSTKMMLVACTAISYTRTHVQEKSGFIDKKVVVPQ